MTGVVIRRRHNKKRNLDRTQREGHVKMEAEIGVMH